MTAESSISLATAQQMDAQARQLEELTEQYEQQRSQQLLHIDKMDQLQAQHRAEVEDLRTEIAKLRSLRGTSASTSESEGAADEEQEDEEEETGSETEADASESDVPKPPAVTGANGCKGEERLEIPEPIPIPDRDVWIEAYKVSAGCSWCSRPCNV